MESALCVCVCVCACVRACVCVCAVDLQSDVEPSQSSVRPLAPRGIARGRAGGWGGGGRGVGRRVQAPPQRGGTGAGLRGRGGCGGAAGTGPHVCTARRPRRGGCEARRTAAVAIGRGAGRADHLRDGDDTRPHRRRTRSENGSWASRGARAHDLRPLAHPPPLAVPLQHVQRPERPECGRFAGDRVVRPTIRGDLRRRSTATQEQRERGLR